RAVISKNGLLRRGYGRGHLSSAPFLSFFRGAESSDPRRPFVFGDWRLRGRLFRPGLAAALRRTRRGFALVPAARSGDGPDRGSKGLVAMESEIRTFLNSLRVEKGLSYNTLEAYRRDIEKFAAFASERGLWVKSVGRSDIV